MRIVLFLLICFTSQNICSQRHAEDFAVINIGLHGFVAGVGAVINKNGEEKAGKRFLKGFLKGSIGGSLIYSGKLMIGNVGKESNLIYAWPGKITYWAGNSIMENAAMNRPIFEQYNMNLGIVRFEYKFSNSQIKTKILPLTTIITGYIASQSKFEWEKSLATGELIFSSSKFNNKLDMGFSGFTTGNVVVLGSEFVNNNGTISHEIIHIAQNNDFNFTNAWLIPSLNQNSFFLKTTPFIYYEFNTLFNQGVYWTQYRKGDNYYRNIFESEAATLSQTFGKYSYL